MTIKKKILNGLSILTVAGVLTIGGTMAYLTDYDTKLNEFTVGKVDIQLQEPTWNPEDHTQIIPAQQISKDPQIENTGKNDAYVYLQVGIPVRSIVTADDAGKIQPEKNTELFSYEPSDTWSLIQSEASDGYQLYTYCYNKVLKPEERTTALFETVKFANIVENQLSEESIHIPVNAYAIQAENMEGTGTFVEQATQAYQKYVNQNKPVGGEL